MAMDKGKSIDRSPPTVAVITPEALHVLLDALQALTLGQAPSAPTEPQSDTAATDNAFSSASTGDDVSLAALPSPAAASSSSATAATTAGGVAPTGVTSVTPVHHGFHCSACGVYNVGQSMSAWYVITAVRQVGIFASWSLVQPHVTGVPHACFRRYPNREAAQWAYNEVMAVGLVHVLP